MSVDQAVRDLIRDVLTTGDVVEGVAPPSIGSGRRTRELLNVQTTITDPVNRLSDVTSDSFGLVTAVARTIWMLAGNDRLDDIAYYEPGVLRFTDNGRTVPGSSFGRRLRDPEPGLDQVQAVIRRLRADPQSRRALSVVYAPGDTVRESRDIPCLLAVNFRLRPDGLHATTVMRSNNVYRLAPYNLFELSFLSEIVAVELGVPFAQLTHLCLSAHVYEDDADAAGEWADRSKRAVLSWPPMPTAVPPLEAVDRIVRLEGRLRSDVIDRASLDVWVSGLEGVHEYWRSLVLILATFVAENRNIPDAEQVLEPLMMPAIAAIYRMSRETARHGR